MVLNLTCIIQVIHFFIALYIIDVLFLRTAVAYIEVEDRKRAMLEQQLHAQQERVAEYQEYNTQDWHILQKRLQAECPEQLSRIQKIPIEAFSALHSCTVSPEETGRLVQELRQLMVGRVLRD